MKKPRIDEAICIHCGTCSGVCPEVFADGPEIKELGDYQEFAEKIEQAIKYCPVAAIDWEED